MNFSCCEIEDALFARFKREEKAIVAKVRLAIRKYFGGEYIQEDIRHEWKLYALKEDATIDIVDVFVYGLCEGMMYDLDDIEKEALSSVLCIYWMRCKTLEKKAMKCEKNVSELEQGGTRYEK